MGARGQHADERNPAGLRSDMYYAILRLIIREPSHGYELQQRYERRWGESRPLTSKGQIYKGLESLEERGMIEQVPGTGEGRHNRTFRHTELGMEFYTRHVIARAAEEARRTFGWGEEIAELPTPVALLVLDAYEKATYAAAKRLAALEEDPAADEVTRLGTRLAVEWLRSAQDGRIAWIESARRELEALRDQQPPHARVAGEEPPHARAAGEEPPGDGAA